MLYTVLWGFEEFGDLTTWPSNLTCAVESPTQSGEFEFGRWEKKNASARLCFLLPRIWKMRDRNPLPLKGVFCSCLLWLSCGCLVVVSYCLVFLSWLVISCGCLVLSCLLTIMRRLLMSLWLLAAAYWLFCGCLVLSCLVLSLPCIVFWSSCLVLWLSCLPLSCACFVVVFKVE